MGTALLKSMFDTIEVGRNPGSKPVYLTRLPSIFDNASGDKAIPSDNPEDEERQTEKAGWLIKHMPGRSAYIYKMPEWEARWVIINKGVLSYRIDQHLKDRLIIETKDIIVTYEGSKIRKCDMV